MKLLVVIPLTASDLPVTSACLKHIASIGQCLNHQALAIADFSMTKEQCEPIAELMKSVFPLGGKIIKTPLTLANESWPYGYNFRFETAARYIAEHVKRPFLWLDPRARPTRKSWLNELEVEYLRARKPFMGHVLSPASHGTPHPLLASTAIYPAELPKRMLQFLVARRGVDFERSCADVVVPLTHPTGLIWSIPAGVNKPAPKEAALVHGGQPNESPLFHVEQSAKTAEPVPVAPPKAPAVVPPPTATYYHSGDLGDIIYGLAAIRCAGGGKLILGPRSRKTLPPANPMREQKFALLEPLLRQQPYIIKASYLDRHPGTDNAFDLNIFRNHWGEREKRLRTGIKTLASMHAWTLGVLERFRPDEAWLRVESPIVTPFFAVHRSSRYRADNGSAFPWKMVLEHYAGRLLFVGLAQEHGDFQREFQVSLPFYQCADFLDLARVIAGAQGFIGNQSFPMALALGLGQRVLQEAWPVSPDCLLPRSNLLTQPFVEGQLPVWEKKALVPMVAAPAEKAKEVPLPPAPTSPLYITAPVENFTGFGQLVNAVVTGIFKDHAVAVQPFVKETTTAPLSKALELALVDKLPRRDLLICAVIEVPMRLVKGEVVLTMWEASRITKDIVDAMNDRAACVVVPTKWNEEGFRASGVTCPIRVVPLGIDPSVYQQEYFPQNKNWCFGTAGRLAHAGARKGIEQTIECFLKAFPKTPDVRLHVKVFADCPLDQVPKDSRIIVMRGFMPDLRDWYRKIHCFVSTTHGEGWGLHIHQAMAMGRSVIVPRHGGQSAFVTEENAYCLKHTLQDCDWGPYIGSGMWAVVDQQDVITKMRHVYENQSEAATKGELAAHDATAFTWDRTVNELVAVLKEFGKL